MCSWGFKSMIVNIESLKSAALQTEPFPHFCVTDFLAKDDVDKAIADFPKIDHGGLFSLDSVDASGYIARIIKELQSPEVAAIVGAKLGIDLSGMSTMITVRAQARNKDGQIHTDATFKKATMLLYLNDGWEEEGGRLRILRSGTNIEDYTAEIPPLGGTLVGFLCTPNAWHGHLPHQGTRRYIMCNFVADQSMLKRELMRHRFTAQLKKLKKLVGLA